MPELTDLLQQVGKLSDSSLSLLKNIIQTRTLSKGTHLLDFLQVPKSLFFVMKGACRVYYLKDGQDVTDYFAFDGQLIGAVPALFTQQASEKAVEVLEESQIQFLPVYEMELLCEKHLDIANTTRKIAVMGFLEIQKQVEDIRFLSAAQRYHELQKIHPGIDNRVPLKHIASFLGTTQVSLSRIRKGIQ